MGAADSPVRLVFLVIEPGEAERHLGVCGALAQQLEDVVGARLVVGDRHVAPAHGGGLHAGHGVVERQAYGVEYRRFAAARLARYQEDRSLAERAGVELDGGVLDRGEIADGECLESHESRFFVSKRCITSAKSCRSTSPNSRPLSA